MNNKTISIDLIDTEDNFPIRYTVSNKTTKGVSAGWHLVELLDKTFDREFTFRYAMIDEFIRALQEIKIVIKE